MMNVMCSYLFVVVLTTTATARKLREYEFIMAHDAATAMLPLIQHNPKIENIVNLYAQTQATGTLDDLLKCGARALDLRVHRNDTSNELNFYHGPANVYYNVSQALLDVVSFLELNAEELVVLIWLCGNDECLAAVNGTLLELQLPTIHWNCTSYADIANLDVLEVRNISKVRTGGSLLSLNKRCIEMNYDKNITCYKDLHSCTSKKTQSYRFDAFYEYVNRTYEADHGDKLWMIQAHWQYDGTSISIGMLHNSSILDDTCESQINDKFRAWVKERHNSTFSNFVEFDNVCYRTSCSSTIKGSDEVLIIGFVCGGILLVVLIVCCLSKKKRTSKRKSTKMEVELQN
jgi:hypothetical protein